MRTHAERLQKLQRLHPLKRGGVPGGDDPRSYPSAQCRYKGTQHTGCWTPLPSCVLSGLGPQGALAPAIG